MDRSVDMGESDQRIVDQKDLEIHNVDQVIDVCQITLICQSDARMVRAAFPIDSPTDSPIASLADRSGRLQLVILKGAISVAEMADATLISGTDGVRIPVVCSDLHPEDLMDRFVHMRQFDGR